MQTDRNLIDVLAVNCQVTGVADDLECTAVSSARAALAAVRQQSFDLLLTGITVDDTPIWPLIQKLRMVRPKLQWWLVAHGIDPADERLARTLGVARLLAASPTATQILAELPRPRPEVAMRTLVPAASMTP